MMVNNGTAVCTEVNDQILPQIIRDDNGGAFVAWEDYRNNEWDIYGQHINFDSPPISNHPIDIITDASGLETIGWTLDDLIGGGKYRVIVNDTNDNYYVWVDWTSWNGYTILNIPINRTKPGIFNYIIDFYDSIGQYGISDEVEVIILDRIPFTNHPEDIPIELNFIVTIDWILIDDYGTGQYCIIKDGVPGTWSDWVNNTVINYNVNTSIEGSFNYTISYYDSEGQFGIQDTVIVDVIAAETPPPFINGYYVVILNLGVCLMIIFLIYKLRRKTRILLK